jgi:hypothetical protein
MFSSFPTGRTDENVQKVKIIDEGRRRVISEIAGRLGVLFGTCQRVLGEELNARQISEKYDSLLLTQELKEQQILAAINMAVFSLLGSFAQL